MNENELKAAFLKFIFTKKPERFGYGSYWEEQGKKVEVIVASEAEYGTFDLLLFIKVDGMIRQVLPVEVKADTDHLDKRLRKQISKALLTYKESLLVLDVEQAYKAKKLKWFEALPSEIWVRNLKDDSFEQVTEGFTPVHCHISKRAIEKAFGKIEPKELSRLQRRVGQVYSFLHMLESNQWRFNQETKFTDEEANLASLILDRPVLENVIEVRVPRVQKEEVPIIEKKDLGKQLTLVEKQEARVQLENQLKKLRKAAKTPCNKGEDADCGHCDVEICPYRNLNVKSE